MGQIRVVGFDPSLRNWGMTAGLYNPIDNSLTFNHVGVVQPTVTTSKQVRQNSKDLSCAAELYRQALSFAKSAQVVFVEVPIGSQSARAMASYGICVGVLGSLRASNVPFYEVTPTEVKMATVGSKTASKSEMIRWATSRYPGLNWPTQAGRIIEGKAEHMADAIGSVVAGIQLQDFQQLMAIRRHQPTI